MSYILDALKRADAQRERGTVPGLHAQAQTGRSSASAPVSPWPAVAGLLVVALVSLLGWVVWLMQRQDPPAMVSGLKVPVATPVSATPAAAMPVPAVPPRKPIAAAPIKSITPKPPPAALAPAPAPAAPAQAKPASAPASAPQTTLYTRESLPSQIRTLLPSLVFSGGSYSDNPLHRMMIVNGQVFQENAQIAPELTVEQIRPSAAVLNFKGYRFLAPF